TGSTSSEANNFSIADAASTTSVSLTTGASPSTYGQTLTFTATIDGEYGNVKGRNGHVRSHVVTGNVTWSANTGCGTTPVTSGSFGTATCTTSTLAPGSDNVTATYAGDS